MRERRLVFNGTYTSAKRGVALYATHYGRSVLTHLIVWLITAVFLVLSPLLALVALFTGGDRHLRAVALMSFYLVWETLGTLMGMLAFLWALVRGYLPYTEGFCLSHSWMGTLWAAGMFRAGSWILDKPVYWQGDDLRSDPASNAVVFCRHVSSADTMLAPWMMGWRMGFNCRMIMKNQLLLDPVMEGMGTRCRCFFLDRTSKEMELELEGMVGLMPTAQETNVAVTIYPEGTRATAEKRQAVIETLRRRKSRLLSYAQSLKQLLPPRLHGPLRLLRSNHNSDVYFLGHVGYDEALTLMDAVTGATNHKPIFVKVFKVDHRDLPEDEQALEKLLLDNWKKLDAWVDEQKQQIAKDSDAYWERIAKEQKKVKL